MRLSKTESLTKFDSVTKIAIKIDQGINGTSLARFKKEYDNYLALMCSLIKKNCAFFNVVDNMNDNQIIEFSELLMSEFVNVTLEDIQVMFRFAKTGKTGYEKPMSRVDGRLIFRWLNTYLEEKFDRIDELRLIENQQMKQAEKTDDFNPDNLKKISDMFDQKVKEAKAVEFKEQEAKKKETATFEKQVRYIKENIDSYTNDELRSLIKQFELKHVCLAYEPLVEFLKKELAKRPEDDDEF